MTPEELKVKVEELHAVIVEKLAELEEDPKWGGEETRDARGLVHTKRGESTMATWKPDPSFYPSPRMAMKAAPETLAYVAAFDPDRKTPDAIAVVDVDPEFEVLLEDRRQRRDAQHRRRAASFRLERLLLLPVPQRAAPACRAALSGGAGLALLAHPHPRHQARSQEAQDRQGDRARGGRRQGRLHAAAHGALRAGGHLRRGARQRARARGRAACS